MKILQVSPRSGPFAGTTLRFAPGMNVIRGPNGIGKTTILEYASLLGHVCVLEQRELLGLADLQMVVTLSLPDRAFLRALGDGSELPETDLFAVVLEGAGISLEELREIEPPVGSFELGFSYPGITEDELKSVLADEKRIASEIAVSGLADHVLIVKALNLWSRPCGPRDGPWPVTPRFVRACHSLNLPVPAPVFYVNTDMYEFGTGLDIRESPKHLKESMTSVLVNRLQLVRTPPPHSPR